MIKVMDLSYKRKKFSMENVNFALEDGYLMTLLGRNGAGKTTLLNLIYGCLKPSAGKVFWNGADVTGKNAMESKKGDLLYHEEVAYVGNRKWCVESLSCNENVSIIISTHLVEEVNQITDYIGVIENGKLVRFGDREQVLGEAFKEGDNTEGLRGLLEVKNERANR